IFFHAQRHSLRVVPLQWLDRGPGTLLLQCPVHGLDLVQFSALRRLLCCALPPPPTRAILVCHSTAAQAAAFRPRHPNHLVRAVAHGLLVCLHRHGDRSRGTPRRPLVLGKDLLLPRSRHTLRRTVRELCWVGCGRAHLPRHLLSAGTTASRTLAASLCHASPSIGGRPLLWCPGLQSQCDVLDRRIVHGNERAADASSCHRTVDVSPRRAAWGLLLGVTPVAIRQKTLYSAWG